MSQRLQYAQPLFIEERLVATWMGRQATILIGGVLVLLLIGNIVFACVVWRNAPGWSRGLMLFEILLFAAMLVFYRQSSATTVLEPSHLQLRLSFAGITFWKRTIGLRDVRSVEPVNSFDFRSVLQLAGRELRFMTGKTNVRLKLDRANIIVGSAQPEELFERLRQAIATPGDSASVTQSA
jgi:hypothetical protein